VLIRFENGARGSFTVSQVSPGRKNRLSFEVDGGQGSVGWCSRRARCFWSARGRSRVGSCAQSRRCRRWQGCRACRPGHAEGWSDALTNVIRGFYEQVRSGERRPWVATFEDGLRANPPGRRDP